MSPTRRTVIVGLGAAALGSPRLARGQGYPERAVSLIVPFAAGGGSDVLARVLAPVMAEKLGGTIVIENVGGGAGNIGATRAARAAPDGYTLMLTNVGLAINASLYANLPFDPERDFAPIAFLNYSPLVILGRKTHPANTLPELLAWMKENPAKIGHAGTGSISHLAMVPLVRATGGKADMIPYRGGGPAVQDVIAGHIDLTASPLQSGFGPASQGLVKGFAVTSAERTAMLPEAPSIVSELGPDAETTFWNMLLAPAKTPPAITDRIRTTVEAALADPRVVESFAKGGVFAYPKEQRTEEGSRAFLKREIERWGRVIRENKVEPPPT